MPFRLSPRLQEFIPDVQEEAGMVGIGFPGALSMGGGNSRASLHSPHPEIQV